MGDQLGLKPLFWLKPPHSRKVKTNLQVSISFLDGPKITKFFDKISKQPLSLHTSKTNNYKIKIKRKFPNRN
jgi:hypothetical protein